MTVGNEESSQCAQSLESVVTILLRDILANRSIGGADGLRIKLGSLPDEVLNQVALVFGQQKILGLLNDFSRIFDKDLALGGELFGRVH